MSDLLITFADFHFLRPLFLWAILPLILIGALLAYINKQQSGWQSVLAGHLYKHIISQSHAKKIRQPLWLLTLGWIIATLALAGPTWERLPQPVYQLHSGKVVLMDMTMSMRATDVKPNRLARARYKAIDLVKQISEGETGLVAYAGDAFTISPLSSDGQNLTALIPSLSPDIMPIAGSDPALGLKAAIELLQNANYPQGEIFWITDGIDNQQMQEMSELLNSSPYRLSILAVGTEEGAPIQMQNGELLKDNNGAIVLPKLSPANLKTLARQGGGRYVQMQANNTDIEYLINQNSLGSDEQSQDDKGAKDNFGDKWQEMGPYLLLLLLPFAAYSFRRGLLGIVLLGVLLPIYPPQATAGLWQDMWQTKDQQGLKAFNEQNFDEAAQKFDDPLWQGSALYKNQDYENALKAFNKVDSAQGRYNQANTLAQLGKLPEAIKKYDEVLAQQPNNEDAKANKALVEKLLQQQESEEQQKSDQDKQQNDQPQEGDEQQQEQQEQQGDESEQQDSEQQQQDQQQGDDAEQQDQNQQNEESEKNEEQQQEPQEQESPAEEAEAKEGEPEQQQRQMQEQELSDEEKEQMQRMQNLLNRVPDDPAFLLKRKMQIEAQQRKRESPPGNLQRNW